MRFESHLGHSRGVFALTCVQSLWWRPSDARFAGGGLAAAGLSRCVGGGFRVLACGPSAWWNLGYVPSYLAVPAASRWPSLIHGQDLP